MAEDMHEENSPFKPIVIRQSVSQSSSLLGVFRPSKYKLSTIKLEQVYKSQLTEARDYERDTTNTDAVQATCVSCHLVL